jgi:hypothetical protein
LKGKNKSAFPVKSTTDPPISKETFMSTAAVSSTPISQQLQQYFQTRRTDLQQLGKALENGNLAGAQSAFNKIVQLGQNGPKANGDPFLISQREQDFNAIGQALKAGDLVGAQQAFATLRGTAEKQAGAGGGPGGTLVQPGAGPGPEVVVNLTGPSAGGPSGTLAQPAPGSAAGAGTEIIINLGNSGGTSTNPEQISISIANSANGGEQISFSVGNQNSNPQEITLNLAANSNEQIVLNLLGAAPSASASATGATTSTASGSSASGGLSVTA